MNTLKSLVRSYVEEVWGKGNLTAIDEFLSPSYRRYFSPLAEPLTMEGQKQRLMSFRSAFPDVRITIEAIFAEGDHVIFRSTMSGSHHGVFQGIPPTGKSVTVSLLDVIRVENGRFVEHWGGPDLYDLLKQLGAVFAADQK